MPCSNGYNKSGTNLLRTRQNLRPLRSTMSAFIGLAIGLSAAPGNAASEGSVFLVGPDRDAFRQSETAVLDAEVRKALDDVASADPYVIDRSETEDQASIFIRDGARTPDIIAAVGTHLAGRPDLALLVSPVEVVRFSFPPGASGSGSIDASMRDALILEEFLRDARDDPKTVDIKRDGDGVVVRISDPARSEEFAQAISHGALGFILRAAMITDHSWRITANPAVAGLAIARAEARLGHVLTDAGARETASELVEFELLDQLREPRDLRTVVAADGLLVLIPNPGRYPSFTTKLRADLPVNTRFVRSVSTAQLLTVRRRSNARKPDSDGGAAGTPTPGFIARVAAEVNDLADPPPPEIGTSPVPGGLEIRTRDAAHRSAVAAAIRDQFAGRQDLSVEIQADQSVQVTFASGYLESKVPDASVLANSVRACMGTWKLNPSHVSVMGRDQIEVNFASDAEAERFRHFAFSRCGFMMRVVDRDAGADPTEPPPAVGDERFPQAGQSSLPLTSPSDNPTLTGKDDLWLKPGIFISGNMIAETKAAVDHPDGPVVRFRFTAEGQRRFAAVTSASVDQRLAIVFDGSVLSAPWIMAPITGDSGEIAGDFTIETARHLANAILTSKPHFPIKIIEEAGGPRR